MSLPPRTSADVLTPDDPRWAEALGRTGHDLFHLPGYLRASVAAEPGEPLLFLLDAGDCGMLAPLIKRSLAPFGEAYRGFHDAISPYGYPGPVYWGDNRPEQLAAMHQLFAARLRDAGIVTLFLRLHPFLAATEGILAALGALGELRQQGPVVFMDLRDAEGSWRGINPGNKRAIKRALRAGCEVRFDEWASMDRVMAAYHETMRRHEAPASYLFPPAFFMALRECAGRNLHLATSYDGLGAVTGGVFFSECGGLIHYFLTGTFAAYAALSPSKVLINALRLWGLERGCHTLNLGGGLGAREDSLFAFKIRLAKTTARFHTLRAVLLPEQYRSLGSGLEHDGDFFPCYRRPAATSASAR